MSAHQSIELAKLLPPRLLRFFQRYPPPALFPQLASPNTPSTAHTALSLPPTLPATEITSKISSTNSDASKVEISLPESPIAVPSSSPSGVPPHAHDLPYPNPFLPRKNFATGRWHSPVYGLRKQADLVKLASQHGVVDLLPWTIKKPGERETRRIEKGLRVKGTGEGQKVKGKLWERILRERVETRRQAMLNMPALIQEWKRKGHGRGWKKWPSGKAKK